MTDTVVSASVAANDANIVKAKLATVEADLENALKYIETLYSAHHVAAGVILGLIAGLIVGAIV